MEQISIYFINKHNNDKDNIETKDDNVIVRIYISDLSNYIIVNQINNITNIFKLYKNIKKINIAFDKNINNKDIYKILSKVHDITYSYNNKIDYEYKIYNVDSKTKKILKYLDQYKDIVMDPNKTQDTYIKWIEKQIPSNYNHSIKKTTDKFFPLTNSVGKGSNYDSYFVHVFPKKIDKNKKNIYLIGKSVIYDSGGINIKGANMYEMKVDMIGSGIIITVLKLLATNNMDKKYNIHLLIPVVENMISSKATRPGTIIKSMSGTTVEIINTDAEGRLCMADCIDYINMNLLNNTDDNLIIDIATLTGNTIYISGGISTIAMCNTNGTKYMNKMQNIGEDIGEYIDVLKIRDEYNDSLYSNVADIKNCDYNNKAGCVTAGLFLKYFVGNDTPWIHLDVASTTYKKDMVCSHGVNLLYQFISSL